jgi:hypothetical protein
MPKLTVIAAQRFKHGFLCGFIVGPDNTLTGPVQKFPNR